VNVSEAKIRHGSASAINISKKEILLEMQNPFQKRKYKRNRRVTWNSGFQLQKTRCKMIHAKGKKPGSKMIRLFRLNIEQHGKGYRIQRSGGM